MLRSVLLWSVPSVLLVFILLCFLLPPELGIVRFHHARVVRAPAAADDQPQLRRTTTRKGEKKGIRVVVVVAIRRTPLVGLYLLEPFGCNQLPQCAVEPRPDLARMAVEVDEDR